MVRYIEKQGFNAYIITINDYNGIIPVISMLNGNMKTKKIFALYKLIDFYNEYKEGNLEKKSINTAASHASLIVFL